MIQPGTLFKGLPRRTVEIAFAWTSGPGIASLPKDTGCWSWNVDAHGPTTTILSRKKPGGALSLTASENEIALNVSAGPRKSIQVFPNGLTVRPARSAATTASVFRSPIRYRIRRM